MKPGHVPIYFFVPENPEGRGLPSDIKDYWHWVCDVEKLIRWDGRFSWTLQTYLQLRSCDLNVELVDHLPAEGIIVAHRDFLTDITYPRGNSVLVALKPDRNPHAFAQIHVTQSISDPMLSTLDGPYWHNFVMPLWPQPDLIERDKGRGSVFSKVCYVGRIEHLANELRTEAWAQLLKTELDLEWEIRALNQWHDYSSIDAIVAVRGFGDEIAQTCGTTDDIRMKPSSKLTNSWLAGVPAILGAEPAYRQLRKSLLDYVEVQSKEEVFEVLKVLKQNTSLQQAIAKNGEQRAKQYAVEALRVMWKELLFEKCMPLYRLWQNADYRRNFFLHRREQFEAKEQGSRGSQCMPVTLRV